MIINKLLKPLNKFLIKRGFGRQIVYLPTDRMHDSESRDMSMEKIDSIMSAANSGETSRLYQVAEEIFDKNWDIRQALSTRFAAVNGTPWSIEPASKSAFDIQVAADLKSELLIAGAGCDELISFKELLRSLVFGIYTGVSASEIVWNPGGSIAGFSPLQGRSLTFRDNFYRPKLNTNMGLMELPADKFIVQIVRGAAGDPARGGLIRILAHLHCFSNVQIKYLLRFVERYGMPFTVAKVDEKTWNEERNVLKEMIQNFGPDGGGIFTRSTELELLQASNNTGDVYFKLLQYLGDAVTKVILGQLASSSVSSGLSGGDAQSSVRQDILEDDCSLIETTANSKFIPVWVKFNYGPDAKAPVFKYQILPPEDVIKKYNALKSQFDAMGIAIRAGTLTATAEIEAEVRKQLNLPPMGPEALAEWARLKGAKRPITLAYADVPAPQNPGLAFSEDGGPVGQVSKVGQSDILSGNALSKFAGNADKWAGEFAKTVAKLAESGTPEEIAALSSDKSKLPGLFDTGTLAAAIENTIFASAAAGAAGKLDELKRKKKTGGKGK